MTDNDWLALGRYVRACANELGLRDWHFELARDFVDHATCDGQYALADVTPTYGRRHARIRVAAHFRETSAETQREAIVHELLHCHTLPIRDVVRDALVECGRLIQSEVDLIRASVARAEEYAVDAIASSSAAHFPLIDWNDVALPALDLSISAAPVERAPQCKRRAPYSGERCALDAAHEGGHRTAGKHAWCGETRCGLEEIVECTEPPAHTGPHYDERKPSRGTWFFPTCDARHVSTTLVDDEDGVKRVEDRCELSPGHTGKHQRGALAWR